MGELVRKFDEELHPQEIKERLYNSEQDIIALRALYEDELTRRRMLERIILSMWDILGASYSASLPSTNKCTDD